MSKNLFIGQLPYSITSKALEELFSEIGPVSSARVIIDRETGNSKGFGFVEMENESDIEKAINEFNGKEIEGRNIVVNIAKPKEDNANRNRYGNKRGFNAKTRTNNVRRRH